jgi:hypothetical protein
LSGSGRAEEGAGQQQVGPDDDEQTVRFASDGVVQTGKPRPVDLGVAEPLGSHDTETNNDQEKEQFLHSAHLIAVPGPPGGSPDRLAGPGSRSPTDRL